VIFSCVRAKSRAEGDSPGVGFLADVRRMNVALTRARRALWIVGHSETLKVWYTGKREA
jgi:senataxin